MSPLESAVSPPPANRCRWGIHLALIAGYVLVMGLWGLRQTRPSAAALSETVGGLLWVCALDLLVFGLVLGLACAASRATRDDLLLRWKGTVAPVFLGAGYSIVLRLGLALCAIVTGITLVASGLATPNALRSFVLENRPRVDLAVDVNTLNRSPSYFWLTLTLVSFVVAGLREELWRSAFLAGMKALWPRQFGSRAGQIGAVLLGAVVFGLGHLSMGPIAVGAAAFLGVGLGFIMVWHRSIWPAVIAHGCFNAASFALIPWVMSRLASSAPVP